MNKDAHGEILHDSVRPTSMELCSDARIFTTIFVKIGVVWKRSPPSIKCALFFSSNLFNEI